MQRAAVHDDTAKHVVATAIDGRVPAVVAQVEVDRVADKRVELFEPPRHRLGESLDVQHKDFRERVLEHVSPLRTAALLAFVTVPAF